MPDHNIMKEQNMQQVSAKQRVVHFLVKFFLYAFLILMAVIVLFPFYWMIISSLKTLAEYQLNIPTFWPKEIMPEFMQTLSNFMPTAWFLNGAEKILDGKGLLAAGPEILYLLALSSLLLIIDFSIKPTKVK